MIASAHDGGNGGSGGALLLVQVELGNTGGYSPVEGYAGGAGTSGGYAGGGGGGAGEVGDANGGSGGSATGGNGGDGIQNAYRTGSNVWYGGGGGGGSSNSQGTGGQGGGGNGGNPGSDGTVNTGGGGGGTSWTAGSDGGSGGSGIIVVRYVEDTMITAGDMSLVSVSTTAQTAPTKGDLVMTYTNGAGTAVIGTNITAEYSADNGSTWTDFGIAAGDVQGTTGGHTIVTKHDVALTSTSGTSMKWRVKTLVQSASMDQRIHAVSLGWS